MRLPASLSVALPEERRDVRPRVVSAIAAVLRGAARLLEEKGWTYRSDAIDHQGRPVDPLGELACYFSVDGAILLSAWCHQPLPAPEWEQYYLNLADAAEAQFRRVHGRGPAAVEATMPGVVALCRLLREAAAAHEEEVQ